MAVVTLYMSDRDKSKTFTDKKEADNYDKMLELAENVSLWVEREIEDLNEQQVEALGLLIAQNKDVLAKAFKARPEQLLEKPEEASEDKVTPISANG
ncbi:YebG family protein [Pleionea sp. CnH1-48]|uniref:YebG family protein n=1 Tax=Pleionea sp. CnH1-48 TaxID=2954494 RepID=UPI0020979F11|nr:YebG family protein [Pleionea sp. CnH1-48]MCO7223942.1 YebG family protein [Pleionea sp. CnH1-48]